MKTLLFAVPVLFTVLIVSCEQKTNPVAEYGEKQVDSYLGSKKAAEEIKFKNIQTAIQMYRSANDEYPKTLKDIEGIMDSPIDTDLYQYNPENGELRLKNE